MAKSKEQEREAQEVRNRVNQETTDRVARWNREFREEHRRLVGLPISERAKVMRIPDLMWAAHVPRGMQMPDETRKYIVQMQEQFFEKYPKRGYALPQGYKQLLMKEVVDPSKKKNHVETVLRTEILNIVERLLYEDMLLST